MPYARELLFYAVKAGGYCVSRHTHDSRYVVISGIIKPHEDNCLVFCMQSGNEAMQCLYAFAVSVGFIAYKVIKSVKAFRGVGVADLFAYGRYAGGYDYPVYPST